VCTINAKEELNKVVTNLKTLFASVTSVDFDMLHSLNFDFIRD